VIFINISERLSLWFKFKPLVDSYKGYNLDGSKLSKSPEFSAEYKFWSKNLILKQFSEERGNWKSHLHIISEIPYNSTGIFRYDKKGKYGDNWGLHEVTINFEEQIFHIKAHAKKGAGTAEYVLKKA
jgi:hypothetical protein